MYSDIFFPSAEKILITIIWMIYLFAAMFAKADNWQTQSVQMTEICRANIDRNFNRHTIIISPFHFCSQINMGSSVKRESERGEKINQWHLYLGPGSIYSISGNQWNKLPRTNVYAELVHDRIKSIAFSCDRENIYISILYAVINRPG